MVRHRSCRRTHRSRLGVTDPSLYMALGEVAPAIEAARLWLAGSSPTTAIQPRPRTVEEATERRTELDAILASAPADQTDFIASLVIGQLSLTDTVDVLREAVLQQGDRRRWILEHWPHIVERAEVDQVSPATLQFEIEL